MHFIRAVALGASALFSIAAAQSSSLAFTSTPSSVTAGKAVTIKYTASDLSDPVTILLRKGNPDDLQTITVLTSSATGGSYTWEPQDWLANADDYALEITQGNEINYTGQISLSGDNPSAASAAAASTSSGAVSSAALTSMLSQSSVISSLQSAISSANSSLANLTATATPTMTGTGASGSLGTGIPMTRNTTMSSATIRSTSGSTTSAPATTTSGAGFQGTSTSASASATSSGAASSNVVAGSSTLALVVCAFAAIIY